MNKVVINDDRGGVYLVSDQVLSAMMKLLEGLGEDDVINVEDALLPDGVDVSDIVLCLSSDAAFMDLYRKYYGAKGGASKFGYKGAVLQKIHRVLRDHGLHDGGLNVDSVLSSLRALVSK